MALSSPAVALAGSQADDESAVRAFIQGGEAPTATVRQAPDLDWENAFGIRYTNLAKRDAFYKAVVTPLQVGDTGGTLEVKVRFIGSTVAVADEYWHEIGQRDVKTLKRGPDRWGRTTYVFQKADGVWNEVLERVADLRLAYYTHYDALPSPIRLTEAQFASISGSYVFSDGRTITLSRANDRFVAVTSSKRRPGPFVGIPVSISRVLLFDPNDLAEYEEIDVSGATAIFSYDGGTDPEPLTKR
jgi:hypothetical protein